VGRASPRAAFFQGFIQRITDQNFRCRICGAKSFCQFARVRRARAGDRHAENFAASGARISHIGRQSLSPRKPTMNVSGTPAGKAARRASTPATLCAPSSRIFCPSGFSINCKRPGQFTFCKPSRIFSSRDGNLLLQNFHRRQRKRGIYFLMFAEQRQKRQFGIPNYLTAESAAFVSGAFFSRAIFSMTASADFSSVAVTTGIPGLMMPAFSAAIFPACRRAIAGGRTRCS
jgi:hypothetical protein